MPTPAPDRVLLAGDSHGDAAFVEELCRVAVDQGCRLILQLGDFGYFPRTEAGRAFLASVGRSCTRADVDLWWLDGNHDDHDTLATLAADPAHAVPVAERVRHLPRGHRFTLGGVRFGCLGGAHSIDRARRTRGVDWWEDENPRPEDLVRLGTEPLDVLLSHDAPLGVPESSVLRSLPEDDRSTVQRGRSLLRRAAVATRPRLFVHGHVHRASRAEVHLEEAANGGLRLPVVSLAANGAGDAAWRVLELPSLALLPGGDR
ncbi:metallophosphoesterase [Streptomyces sp. R44]|uniref:Metallophosphoesterase n=1 Tax=Streptomyces sp. R44 TaxID=3238633 RepID=A0AB39TE59_9ACTN